MRQRVSERKPVAEAPLLYRFVKTIAGDLSSYNIAYTQVYETARNVLIREKFVRGVSLRTYMKDPAKTKQVKKIKKVLTLELIRQIFEDGIYHADLHPGNVMIYENPNGKIDITIIDMGGVTRISESEKQKVEKLFTKILRWKAKSFIYPFAKLDVSRELGYLSFKSQKFLYKVSYLFGEKRLVSSAAKRSEKEVAKETPASAPLESLTGIDDIMDVFPVLRTVKMLRGQTARIDRLIGKRLTVKASWLVLGSKEPAQPGKDFTGILKKVYVTKRGDGYATLNLHFNNFSGISPRMSYLERMKDAGHTFEINIMDRDGNWVANSNLIITSIEEAREGGELSPIGLSDGGAIAQLTPAGIELRDEIQMSDELKNWNIRHEEWHNWANNNIRLPDVSTDRQKAISEAVAIILAFRGMKEINDTHLKALLAAVGANPDAISSDLTDMDLIKGVVRYLAETRPGYEGALSGSEETIIAFIRQALVVAPQPATVVNSKDALYGAAQKTIPQIMEVINKNSPTFDTAPAPEDDISPTTNCDRSVEQLLGKEGHAIYARHYKVGKTAEESFNNLLSHMEKSDIIQKFDAAVKSNPSSRWMVRVLSLDAKSRVERHIKQELVKLNTNEAGKVDENAVANAFNRIHVMVETVKDAAHLNTVIDLFVDIGIMELDRYTQGDYEGQATVEFKNDLANLLRLSVTNLENLSGNTLEEILKKIFEGSVILMIKAIDWKSIQEWKKSQDEVLRAL